MKGRSRGVVLATAHTGNWDLAACAARDAGISLTLVTKRLRVTSLDRFWQRVREARGVELVSGEGAFAESLEALARGRAVALMIDQAPERTSAVTSVSFFGAPARCDVTPALLAARAGVPLVLLLGHRTEGGRHVLDAPLVLEPPRRPSRAWLEEATRQLTRALESFVAEHPEQWLWLHRRWKTHEPAPMRRPSKRGAPGAPARQGGRTPLSRYLGDAKPRDMGEDVLVVGKHSFRSRLIVGTGKYKDVAETERALAASGAELVTVALRRVNLQERGEGSLMSLLTRGTWKLLPNTAGCYTADEAVRTLSARARAGPFRFGEARGHRRREDALPRQRADARGGQAVGRRRVHCSAVLHRRSHRLPQARRHGLRGGDAARGTHWHRVSGFAILTTWRIILEHAKVPVIVDAGVGTASDAAVAMELGCHGVLMNTAIAGARDPILMAEAMRDGVAARTKGVFGRAHREKAVRDRIEPGGRAHLT